MMQGEEAKKSSVPIVGIAAILIVVVSVAMMIIALNGAKKTEKDDSGNATSETFAGETIGEHERGKLDSDVVVLEYADMQCPGCASMMSTMEGLYGKYGDRVKFVYRHYPLAMHQNATQASIAVEAAGRQGFFWEMLSSVFESQADWGYLSGNRLTTEFVNVFKTASDGKGDLGKFKNDYSSDTALRDKVNTDKELGVKDELNATPTILVNGEKVDLSKSKIEAAIEEALK